MDHTYESQETENLAQTLARELKVPQTLSSERSTLDVALPPGWKLEKIDHEKLQSNPRRIVTSATLATKAAFVEYVRRHQGGAGASTVWCDTHPESMKIGFSAILDDHGPAGTIAGWRAHRAAFNPCLSVEWQRWTGSNNKQCTQDVFARFLEDNQKDINGGDGFPGGNEMLAMALEFEARQDQSFKSALRLQSGGIRMEYVPADDAGTIQAMQVFERFRIAIPVFRDDEARYPIIARLRYRAQGGKLAFWFELVRHDLVFEQSSLALLDFVRSRCELPFFVGNPG